MAKRTICIQSSASIAVEQGSLQISMRESKASIPLEDIWVVILESHRANITVPALSAICDAGIGVMTCGEDHHPNGLLLPLGAHSRHAAIVESQLAISKPLGKQLWKKIVEAKISNQAKVLDLLGRDGSATLREYSKRVQSGDSSNRESVAAAYYFKQLLPVGTRRVGPYSRQLDYGYSILRAGIARTAVAGGWLVSRGIHHSNDYNAFNLVDDLIEPFRPIVDYVVVSNDLKSELHAEEKRILLGVFELEVCMNGKMYTVQSAIEYMLDSFKDAVLEKNPQLLVIPSISGLKLRRGYEG